MASINVSNNPSSSNNTLIVNFTTDVTNITDIQISKDGGNSYISANGFNSKSATFDISSWENGTYTNCKLKCVYVQNAYNITNNLTNCTTNNNNLFIEEGSSYSATISANTNYKMSSITVTMGGTNITSSAVSGNNISISNVTGNIVITATATQISSGGGTGGGDGSFDNYIITYNLTNCTSSNTSNTIFAGTSYSTQITANSGYTISGIIVTMGGIDITNTVVDSNNNINISSVNGDITITAGAQSSAAISYIINYNLVKCTSSNKASYANENSSYSTSITADSGYTLGNVIVTMGGADITSSAVSGGNITISKVTGNIVIAAEATATSSGGSGKNILPPLIQWGRTSGITSVTTSGDYSATIAATSSGENLFTILNDISEGDELKLSCSDMSSNLKIEITDSKGFTVKSMLSGGQTASITANNAFPYTIKIWVNSGTGGTISNVSLMKPNTSGGSI